MGKKRDFNALLEYDRLSQEEKAIMLDWIRDHLRRRRSPNEQMSSYRLKHEMASDNLLYVTNGAIKKAMEKMGFDPIDRGRVNWTFCIDYVRNGKIVRYPRPIV